MEQTLAKQEPKPTQEPKQELAEAEPHASAAPADLSGFRERSLQRGVNPVLYWSLRAILVPFFLRLLPPAAHRPRAPAAHAGRCCWPPTTAASSTRS